MSLFTSTMQRETASCSLSQDYMRLHKTRVLSWNATFWTTAGCSYLSLFPFSLCLFARSFFLLFLMLSSSLFLVHSFVLSLSPSLSFSLSQRQTGPTRIGARWLMRIRESSQTMRSSASPSSSMTRTSKTCSCSSVLFRDNDLNFFLS